MDKKLEEKITQLIKSHRVVLFMKGDKFMPKCGFSARVVEILNDLGADYTTYDILEDEELRSGLKEYSSWPTYPQLYINAELIGGCDIITEMYAEGELKEIIDEDNN